MAQEGAIDIEMLDEFSEYLPVHLGNRRRRRLHQSGGDAGDQVAWQDLLRCEAKLGVSRQSLVWLIKRLFNLCSNSGAPVREVYTPSMRNVALRDERYGLSDNARQYRWFSGPSRPAGFATRGQFGRRFWLRSAPMCRAAAGPDGTADRPAYSAAPHLDTTASGGNRRRFARSEQAFCGRCGESRLSIPHVSKELICKYLTDLKLIGALEK
jgi:hypothetical protein